MRSTIAIGTISATAAAFIAASVHAEVVSSSYINTTNYAYKILHMPDFDQRRAESADGTIPGLPNDGSMYCVPTSSMNVCAYIATHGFPTVPPQDYPWTDPSSYDVATGSDFILGLLMGTSPTGGTGGSGWYNGIQAWVPLDKFTVNAYFADDAWWPRRWDLAQSACNGGLISFCWGWYDVVGEMVGIPVVDRDGGHCVTLTEALGGSTNARIWLRDPADDTADLTTQSDFMNRMYWAEGRSIVLNGQIRSVDNLVTSPGGGISRIVDGYCSVRPKAGVTYIEPVQAWSFQLAGDLLGSLQYIDGAIIPTDEPVEQFEIGLHQNALYAIVDIGEGNHLLHCYPFGGSDPVVLDFTFGEVDAITLGTHHRLYIASGSEMHMVDVGGEFMSYQWALPLIGRSGAVAYDDANDRVLTYDTDQFAVLSYPWHGDGLPQATDVPAEIAGAAEGHAMAWDATRNAVWMIADFQPVAYKIPLGGGPATAVELPGASEVTDITVDDQGHLLVADNGVLREYAQNVGGAWVSHEGPLVGMTVGQKVLVTRSRTNFNPNLHVEGWHNVLPEEDFGNPVPDCNADVNGDGVVDFADLVALLATFGPCAADVDCSADLDDDGAVTFADLLAVLAAWGPCPA